MPKCADLSGAGPMLPDGSMMLGKVGRDVDKEEGYEAARLCAQCHLSTLRGALGSLDKVERMVKVLGMVNATPDYTEQPYVINGYTELMKKVFGYEHG